MLGFLFPPKCVLCRRLLEKHQTDLCHQCRATVQEMNNSKFRIPFVAKWTAVWYYSGDVRNSIHRFKFYNARGYGDVYARLMAQKLQETEIDREVQAVTWVPVSLIRRLSRGYDQSRLLAFAIGKELGLPVIHALKKPRHTKPQSSLRTAPERKANITGAFRIKDPRQIAGKRILLVDDILTTGVTSSECARLLLTAGAKDVYFAAIAAAYHENRSKRR